MNKQSAFLALLAAAITFSSFGLFIRILSEYFGVFTQISLRFAVATIILLIISKATHQTRKLAIKPPDKKYFAIFLPIFPLSIIFFASSVLTTKASNAFFYLYATGILNGIILGKVLFKEHVSKQKLAAITIAIVGLYAFTYPFTISSVNLGLVFGLLAGIGDSTTNAMRKKLSSYNSNTLIRYQYFIGFIFTAIIAIISQEALVQALDLRAIITLLLFSSGITAIGYLTFYGFKYFDLNIGTIVVSSEMFLALIVSAIFLHEFPTSFELLGGFLIFLAVVLVNLTLKTTKNPK